MGDRQETERRLIEAVGRLLSSQGFRHLGVNAVAREAGVDKVLIYRYFGGLKGLLEAFGREEEFWPPPEELLPPASADDDLSPAELSKEMIKRFGRALRKRPMTLEIMRWELMERNALTDTLADARERQALELLARLEAPPSLDVAALAAVLGAAQTYLILRSKTADVYNGVELGSEEGWERIERALELLIDRTLGRALEESRPS